MEILENKEERPNGYSSIELWGVPIFHANTDISVSIMPDCDIIKGVYLCAKFMLASIKESGINIKYSSILEKDNTKRSLMHEYCNMNIDHYSYILVTAQSILDEFRFRFGYDHKLACVIDYCEGYEPALDELDEDETKKFIYVVRTPNNIHNHKKLYYGSDNIDNVIMSWISRYKEEPQLLNFTKRDPKQFQYVRDTPLSPDQRVRIINYWSKFINDLEI